MCCPQRQMGLLHDAQPQPPASKPPTRKRRIESGCCWPDLAALTVGGYFLVPWVNTP